MDVLPSFWVVRSLRETHFTGALNQNEMELETLGSGEEGSANQAAGSRSLINRITVISDQNLDWDVVLFRNTFTPPLPTDADLDPTIDWVSFSASDGKQVAGAGLYRYSFTSLQILYWNTDAPGQLHVGLVNRNAAAKNAGATGEVVIEIQGVTLS